jgi:hypothetical protein
MKTYSIVKINALNINIEGVYFCFVYVSMLKLYANTEQLIVDFEYAGSCSKKTIMYAYTILGTHIFAYKIYVEAQ